MADSRDKLSTPRGAGGGTGYDADAFGRWAESIARFLGTGRYLAGQTVFVIIWILVNIAMVALRFDPYPFILLNLMFSTQAAYAAPLILLAQNRQADRDKDEIERDRQTNARSLAETEFLARELASIRMVLEQKADRDDIVSAIEQLTASLERVSGVSLSDDDDYATERPSDYSADSSHQ